ncbi:MAG: UDP-N-acetylglucosamine--N-acetylmuramyl-(pentapeptide) pyrophosphoryl-undecaprenol [Patescibacteria group bacterium]|nr:UDP-N-acetylglucosamine--N-acetylmuramyl-(pentapeptide) pyrophosphoryl-undecaprenol [Patescibacteria group bacterium]
MLREIKNIHPKAKVRFWCDRKFACQAKLIMNNFDPNIPVQKIFSGKLRRYHHLSVMRQLLWPSLVLKNIGDSFLVFVGFFQSIIKLIIWRPDVVFTKGGYVCLPVGIATRLLRIPLVIHDSDAHPGLTNLILSKWATSIATGAPLEYYPYPLNKSRYVGIPISSEFHKFSKLEVKAAKETWGISVDKPLIVITGGGLGASRINDTVVLVLKDLLKIGSVVLISGACQYDKIKAVVPLNDDHFQLHSFVSEGMASLLGAADVVVTRAGATTILELATLAKPTILIPNAKLTGGHQSKNAAVYLENDAVMVVDEDEMIKTPDLLTSAVNDIVSNAEHTKKMSKAFALFARPDAARDVANMILSNIK